MEQLYLLPKERATLEGQPLTQARYEQWLEWMNWLDAHPKALFEKHSFVDEGALTQNIKTFMDGMVSLQELRDNQRASAALQERFPLIHLYAHLGAENLRQYTITIGGKPYQRLVQEISASHENHCVKDVPNMPTLPTPRTIHLLQIRADDLFQEAGDYSYEDLLDKAHAVGLDLCPLETAFHLRLHIGTPVDRRDPTNQDGTVIMSPTIQYKGKPQLFGLFHSVDTFDGWEGWYVNTVLTRTPKDGRYDGKHVIEALKTFVFLIPDGAPLPPASCHFHAETQNPSV